MISPKYLLYAMIFACCAFTINALEGGFIQTMSIDSMYPILLALGFTALFIAFVASMKVMETKLRIVGLLFCLAGLALGAIGVTMNLFNSNSGFSYLFLFNYLIGLVMMGTFYQTYFWIAIRARETLMAALILVGLSSILVIAGFLSGTGLVRGSVAETSLIGIPGLIVSLIAYFKAKKVIAARTTAQ
jgi:hypothetical protein